MDAAMSDAAALGAQRMEEDDLMNDAAVGAAMTKDIGSEEDEDVGVSEVPEAIEKVYQEALAKLSPDAQDLLDGGGSREVHDTVVAALVIAAHELLRRSMRVMPHQLGAAARHVLQELAVEQSRINAADAADAASTSGTSGTDGSTDPNVFGSMVCGMLLCDQMGLGKTTSSILIWRIHELVKELAMTTNSGARVLRMVQSIEARCYGNGKTLVIVPNTLVAQWTDDLQRHGTPLCVIASVGHIKHCLRQVRSAKVVLVTMEALKQKKTCDWLLSEAAMQAAQAPTIMCPRPRPPRSRFGSRFGADADADANADANPSGAGAGAGAAKRRPAAGRRTVRQVQEEAAAAKLRDQLNPSDRLVWMRLIVDEAHAAKSGSSNTSSVIQQLHATSKVLLTGTPIVNGSADMRRLLEVVGYPQDGALGDQGIHELLPRALVMRRITDEAIAGVLRMSRCQYQVLRYDTDARVAAIRDALERAPGATSHPARVQLLRQLNVTPGLIYADADWKRWAAQASLRGLLPTAAECEQPTALVQWLVNDIRSHTAQQDAHGACKAVVFTHYHSETGTLQKALDAANICCVQYNGEQGSALKQLALNNFNSDHPDSPRVLIASIQCSNVGLNLQVANACYFVNTDPVPAREMQAVARLVRIGQARSVRAVFCNETANDQLAARFQELQRLKLHVTTRLLGEDDGLARHSLRLDEAVATDSGTGTATDGGGGADEGQGSVCSSSYRRVEGQGQGQGRSRKRSSSTGGSSAKRCRLGADGTPGTGTPGSTTDGTPPARKRSSGKRSRLVPPQSVASTATATTTVAEDAVPTPSTSAPVPTAATASDQDQAQAHAPAGTVGAAGASHPLPQSQSRSQPRSPPSGQPSSSRAPAMPQQAEAKAPEQEQEQTTPARRTRSQTQSPIAQLPSSTSATRKARRLANKQARARALRDAEQAAAQAMLEVAAAERAMAEVEEAEEAAEEAAAAARRATHTHTQ